MATSTCEGRANAQIEAASDTAEKVNILMVDDQPAKLLSYEVILRDLGENLIKATSATEALECLLKNDIAVVLTDVSMPDIDGFDLVEMIRQHPRFQKTAVIFISGVHLTDLDRIKGYRQGAVDYITVPVVPELLRAKVSIFAELHRKRRQLESLNQQLEHRVFERTQELRERADLLDLASEAIMVRDLNGRIRFWNSGAEAMYGWSRQEAIGNDVHELLQTRYPVNPGDLATVLVKFGRWDGNVVQRTRDGREIIVASRQAIKKNEGPPTVLEINRDITLNIRAQEALRNAEKLAAMGRVAGIIAHEINNPLEALMNAFMLLREHPSLDGEARTYAGLAEEELDRVAHIVRETLSFYRESKQPVVVSIPDVLNNVIELHARHLALNGITVEKHYRSDAAVHGFPVEMRQVFLNLIGNAIQAMPKGGRLRLQVKECTDWKTLTSGVAVSVLDEGSGINPDDAKRLFEPFFSTKSTKGTGLGLWISKGIIQKYDGAISFRTFHRQNGCFTCFRVFIPGYSAAKKLDKAAGQQAELAS